MPLNAKRRAFVREYLKSKDLLTAYRRAGYAGRGLQARKYASELRNSPEIAAAIAAAERELDEECLDELRREWRVTRAVRRAIAYTSIDQILDFDKTGMPKLKPSAEIPDLALLAVESLEVTRTTDAKGNVKDAVAIKMWPRHPHLNALEEKYSIIFCQ
jgi:phage terminase small subunit